MTHDQQRLAGYLGHILEAIERIERYTEDMNEAAFLNNQLVQDAVIRNFEIIGEASNNIENTIPSLRLRILSCRCRLPTRCAMPSLTATSRWTWKSCGERSTAIFRGCIGRCANLPQSSRDGARPVLQPVQSACAGRQRDQAPAGA